MGEADVEQGEPDYRKEWREECRRRHFERRVFESDRSLRAIEPDEQGWYASQPYVGQEYDPRTFHIVEDGWDHEHCYLCYTHIEPGDDYWQSSEPWPLELCLACHEALTSDGRRA